MFLLPSTGAGRRKVVQKEDAMIVYRVIHFPEIGKIGQQRTIVEERVKQSQADGVRTALIQKMVSDGGPVLVAIRVFDNMEALEKFRDQASSDPARIESSQQEMASLIRKPPTAVRSQRPWSRRSTDILTNALPALRSSPYLASLSGPNNADGKIS